MILYFMKQDALAFMKTNMDVLYTKYFTEENSDWITEAYGQEAFEVFKEIQDIELSPIEGKTSGEIDFENIQIIYNALRNISESQASDERLWAGLCNKVFYNYLRKRWGYDTADIKDAEKDVKGIISRFYFTGSSRGYYFRNSISKCWWVGRLTYDETNLSDRYYYLRAIGSNDLNSKITEIFYNSTFTSNPMILRALFEVLGMYYERNITLLVKEVLRPAISYLNAVGGGILLDALNQDDITKILVEKINSILMGRGSAFIELDEDIEEDEDAFDSEERRVSSVLVQQDELPDIILKNENEAENVYVDYGDEVILEVRDREKTMLKTLTRKISKETSRVQMFALDKGLLGKKVGYKTYSGGKYYIISKIHKQS